MSIKISIDAFITMWYIIYIERSIKKNIIKHFLIRIKINIKRRLKTMARPKLSQETKRIKMNLTISPEVKEMAEMIRIKKNISMSMFFEDYVRAEYKKMVRKGELKDEVQIIGQMKVVDTDMNIK